MRLNNVKRVICGIIVGIAVALSGVMIFAQQGPGKRGEWGARGEGGPRGEGGFFGHLNLTDDQKAAMKAIAAKYEPTLQNLRQQLHQNEKSGFDPLKGGTFDAAAEAALRAQIQARAAAEADIAVTRARMMSEMYAVLTDAQKAQLAQERQQREQRREQRRNAAPPAGK